MPETIGARQKILEYMEKNNVSYGQLETMTGYKRQEIHSAVTGKTRTPRANELILKIIQMFGL